MDAPVLTPSADASTSASAAVAPPSTDPLWWRSAVIYQVYIRSFADGNGDGTGDLAGVRSRLGYLRDLGVDAIWFTPWYASPLADGGYDVSDYRAIDPAFGDARRGRGAHRARRWRSASARSSTSCPTTSRSSTSGSGTALAAGPGSPERERFWFHPGKGPDGDEMPTHWVSNFQGETWTRTTNPDGTPGEWYLHLFTPAAARPQLEPPRRAARARGRAAVLVRPRRRRRAHRLGGAARQGPGAARGAREPGPGGAPEHRPRRACTTSTAAGARSPTRTRAPACSSARCGSPTPSASPHYLRPDEMHTAFNFDFMARPWDAAQLRDSIDDDARRARAGRRAGDLGAVQPRRHPAGHPVRPGGQLVRVREQAVRHPDRPRARHAPGAGRRPADRRTARLALRLPGRRARPARGRGPAGGRCARTRCTSAPNGVDPGRDGCRVPLPWSGTHPPFGFSRPTSSGARRAEPSAAPSRTRGCRSRATGRATRSRRRRHDPRSMLSLYRAALAHPPRRSPRSATARSTWLPSEPRRARLRPRRRLRERHQPRPTTPSPCPPHHEVLLASTELEAQSAAPPAPADSTAWLRTARAAADAPPSTPCPCTSSHHNERQDNEVTEARTLIAGSPRSASSRRSASCSAGGGSAQRQDRDPRRHLPARAPTPQPTTRSPRRRRSSRRPTPTST